MKERVYRFRLLERRLLPAFPGANTLDIGCGIGENLARLLRYGARPCGIDPSADRVRRAREVAPALVAEAEALPWSDHSFDLVYISHVFHHAHHLDRAISEAFRVLRPGGLLFAIETVDDSPLIRLARALQPSWDDDAVLQRFRYAELKQCLEDGGFAVHRGETFNWMYFAWELLPLAFKPFELLSPLFVGIEALFARPLRRFGGHCWMLAQRPGPEIFPAEAWKS